ncbi:MAG TPA: prephenate dehydrogenase/arogenate dehydrogenase family protein [Anaerolineae bacterium]|nr:prephenate dehydrogenase/arogenate dehydrogenase family protein [Anaerolineae bacterium]
MGLGLMGGSLALALRGQCAEVIGVDVDPATIEYAQRQAIIDRAVGVDAPLDCDVLVLAIPVRAILNQLRQLSRSEIPLRLPLSDLPLEGRGAARRASGTVVINQKSTLIIDLGSTKRDILAAMNDLPKHFDPIGGHPLCGKESSGIASAAADLFRGATFVLSPLPRTSPRALALAQQLVAAIGAHPLLLDAEQHDRWVAVTSHLAYLLACVLVNTAERLNARAVWRLVASGFRDTSRLAASDVTMMGDILRTNRPRILDALSAGRAELDRLAALIESQDEAALRAALSHTQQRRAQLFTTQPASNEQLEYEDAVVDLWPGA